MQLLVAGESVSVLFVFSNKACMPAATAIQAAWRGRATRLRHRLRLRRRQTAATALQTAWHDHATRRRAATVTIQAACRGHATRSALRDLLGVCDELRRQPGDPSERLDVYGIGWPGYDFCVALVRPGFMDVYFRCDGCYVDIRRHLRDHVTTVARATLVVQSSLRRWFVRRSLLPAATLKKQIALSREMCRTPIDPARTLTPDDLYLRPVEGGLSWVYCDRDTRFDVVDALALLRPCPVRSAGRVSSIAQRARQHAAFQREMRDWRHWRRTTLAWHAVDEIGGRLYRPRRSGYDKRRYEAALETFLLGAPTLPHGESHDSLHDLAWDDFDGYHEATLEHDFEDESAGELGVQSDDGDDDLSYLSSDDAAYLADSALA